MKTPVSDQHTHTSFSHDCSEPMENQLAAAKKVGLKYIAFTEHLDFDNLANGDYIEPLDLAAYEKKCLAVKNREKDIYVAFGIECGFHPSASRMYAEELPKHKFDVIINSVHSVNGRDPYYRSFYDGRTKAEAYQEYFGIVRESLDVPYRYDVIGHIGYAMRYCPYPDKSLDKGSEEIVRDIFKRAIELDKTVEVNSHVKQTGLGSVPTVPMLKIYKELGGENVTFSSDAHYTARIADKWQAVSDALETLGFRYLTVYKEGKPEKLTLK